MKERDGPFISRRIPRCYGDTQRIIIKLNILGALLIKKPIYVCACACACARRDSLKIHREELRNSTSEEVRDIFQADPRVLCRAICAFPTREESGTQYSAVSPPHTLADSRTSFFSRRAERNGGETGTSVEKKDRIQIPQKPVYPAALDQEN